MALEAHGGLDMELLEGPKTSILLEPIEGLCGRIQRGVAITARLLEVREIAAF